VAIFGPEVYIADSICDSTWQKGQFGRKCQKLLEVCKVYMSH
jgi:hypothetical protein